MAVETSPLTREALREELDRTLRHYATKADLAALETRITKAMAAQSDALTSAMAAQAAAHSAALAARPAGWPDLCWPPRLWPRVSSSPSTGWPASHPRRPFSSNSAAGPDLSFGAVSKCNDQRRLTF